MLTAKFVTNPNPKKEPINQPITDAPAERARGASFTEYALLLVLITFVCIVALRAVGASVSDMFSSVDSTIRTH